MDLKRYQHNYIWCCFFKADVHHQMCDVPSLPKLHPCIYHTVIHQATKEVGYRLMKHCDWLLSLQLYFHYQLQAQIQQPITMLLRPISHLS